MFAENGVSGPGMDFDLHPTTRGSDCHYSSWGSGEEILDLNFLSLGSAEEPKVAGSQFRVDTRGGRDV